MSRLKEILVGGIIALIIATMFSVILLEWVAGCGEIIYYPDRTWKTGECLFIPHEVKHGTW